MSDLSAGWAGFRGIRERDPGEPSLASRLPWSDIATIAMVVLMTYVIGQSTVVMDWVRGSEVFIRVGVLGALLVALLALPRKLPTPVGLSLAVVGFVVIPWWSTAGLLHAAHPNDPFGIPPPDTWLNRVESAVSVDTSLLLWLGSAGFWIVGGWLAWCVIRWRRPLLGLYPGTAVLATNVLNSRDEQNGFTLMFLLLTLCLLLWVSYRGNVIDAVRAGLRMSPDSRWDFWETGVAVTVIVLILAIFVPPLSRSDQTVNFEGGAFRDWAMFQQNLARPVEIGRGTITLLSTGFSTEAALTGAPKRSERVVMTYSINGTFPGPRYFRGVNLQTGFRPTEWAFLGNPYGVSPPVVAKNRAFDYSESGFIERQRTQLKIHMVRPPSTAPDVLFYPGDIQKVDRDVAAIESLRTSPGVAFNTIDELKSLRPATSAGYYTVTISYPYPTVEELRSASTDYPDWISAYRTYPNFAGGAPSSGIAANPVPADPVGVKVKALADQIIRDAGATNPYDMATAIESYLRSNYQYTLTPAIPRDTNPIDYFLFSAKQGYCEYFASALGFLLRAERIPTRLVSGYGPGTYDAKSKQYIVHESDAHVWVESYFPGYGWIPFEPTPDGNYFPIARNARSLGECQRDNCETGSEAVGETTAVGTGKTRRSSEDLPDQGGNLPEKRTVPVWLIVVTLILAGIAIGGLLVSRFLRPRTVRQTWNRLGLLTRLAGEPRQPGETPFEYGRRLGAAFPEVAAPVRRMAEGVALAAYAPTARSDGSRETVLQAWLAIRPRLLRRIGERLRPAW